eukprot:4337336-Alexandrium_andersonii.AAC.1
MPTPCLASSGGADAAGLVPSCDRGPQVSFRRRRSLPPLLMRLRNGAALVPGDLGDFGGIGDEPVSRSD